MKKAMFTDKNRCLLCPHNCLIREGKRGVCGVRINKNGEIFSLSYGMPCALNIDPVEKKPLFHFYPGERIFSLGTYGCNFHCLGCQNWEIARKIPEDKEEIIVYTPKKIVEQAKKENCKLVAYTYTEPTIFYEYVFETSKEAKKNGLKNVIVSNGYINEEPLQALCKFLDGANIDLKSFDEKNHLKYTGGKLINVLKTLKILKEENIWTEITFLLIPGWNDDMEKFEEMCKWIKENLGKEIPLHISRFFPDYKLPDTPPTPIETLHKAKIIADKYLKYAYIGNTIEESNTYCPKCNALLIERAGYHIENKLIKGVCFKCNEKISGRFMSL